MERLLKGTVQRMRHDALMNYGKEPDMRHYVEQLADECLITHDELDRAEDSVLRLRAELDSAMNGYKDCCAENMKLVERLERVERERDVEKQTLSGYKIDGLRAVADLLHNQKITPEMLRKLVENLALAYEIVQKQAEKSIGESIRRHIQGTEVHT